MCWDLSQTTETSTHRCHDVYAHLRMCWKGMRSDRTRDREPLMPTSVLIMWQYWIFQVTIDLAGEIWNHGSYDDLVKATMVSLCGLSPSSPLS